MMLMYKYGLEKFEGTKKKSAGVNSKIFNEISLWFKWRCCQHAKLLYANFCQSNFYT